VHFAYVSFQNCRQRRYKAPYVCELFLCSVINPNQCTPFYIIRSKYISVHSYVNTCSTLTRILLIRKLIPYNVTYNVLKKHKLTLNSMSTEFENLFQRLGDFLFCSMYSSLHSSIFKRDQIKIPETQLTNKF
jgi:hypothetical protein